MIGWSGAVAGGDEFAQAAGAGERDSRRFAMKEQAGEESGEKGVAGAHGVAHGDGTA